MKFIFFCQNSYAFGIIEPIRTVLIERGYEFMWFLREKLNEGFPYKDDDFTNSLKELRSYKADAVIIPGNEVPHYLSGVKVQVFHGLAGEKKSHFRIRHYFDMYLTQGPYFTDKFMEFQKIHKDFKVVETGWSKLDLMFQEKNSYSVEKVDLLQKHQAKQILLFAPTFTPYLTCADILKDEIVKVAANKDYLIIVKFHPLMSAELIEAYKEIANNNLNIIYEEEKNITKFLILSDLLISDTSSVVYEFLLLDKPVITFDNIAEDKYWEDISDPDFLIPKIEENLTQDSFRQHRGRIIENYHPYDDGKSSVRMVDAIEAYIAENGVPRKRKLSPYRKFRIHKRFKDSK